MQPLPKKIAILYSEAKREYFPTEQQFISEIEFLLVLIKVKYFVIH